MPLSQRNKIIAILASFALVSCNQVRPEDRACQADNVSAAEPREESFAFGYFPLAFSEPTESCGNGSFAIIGEVAREWYPRQWRAACEPSFYELSKEAASPKFALRFSYIPSFDPSVFISVLKEGDDYKLIAKKLSGTGGYDPGVINHSKELFLSAEQVAELKRLLEQESLFDEPPVTCELGFDGSQWIFEKVDESGYKMVNRWSPREGTAHSLGQHLIELSGWRVDVY